MWRDPEFRRRFAESFAAESETEPAVSFEEREKMVEILDMISAEQMDDAVFQLEKYRNDTTSAAFDFTLANVYFQQEKFEDAAVNYERAVRKTPKFLRAWKNLGLIRVRQGDFPKALPALTKVVELGGADAVTYGLLGFAYSSVEDPMAAESAYRMANLLDPKTVDWKMGLARSFFRQRRYGDAVALTGTLIAENPDRHDLWMLQANAYLGLKEPMKAAENIELVDRFGKATPASLNLLGDIYVNAELYDMAAKAYVKAMEKDPEASPEGPIRAAKVLASRAALEETETLITRIEELKGDELGPQERTELLHMQARIALSRGADEAQAKVLEEIVKIDPTDGDALILLGTYHRRTGDPEKAVFFYQRAANLEKFEADANVRHAQLLVGEGKYKDAIPLLTRAQQVKPRDNIQEYLEQVKRAASAR